MPRNLPHFTKCASPGDSFSIGEFPNWVPAALLSILIGGAAGAVYAAVMTIIGLVVASGCVIGVGLAGFIIAGILFFKDWYYNHRLMCIHSDRCVIGMVIGAPHDATDGDRKLDILLAPFGRPELEQSLIEVLDSMRGSLPAVPPLADLQDRATLLTYVRSLSDANVTKVYVELAHNKMFSQVGRDFQKHYAIRIQSEMGTAAFNNSPDDSPGGSSPNPMFRFTHKEGNDPEEGVLVPWMHCEVEGNRLARWLDNVLIGVSAGLATFIAVCVICVTVTGGIAAVLCGILGGALGLLLALLIAFLAWLISHFVNDPDDGVADEIDVDVDDPDFTSPATVTTSGDVVVIFGDWVMDEEHNNYFEIHPVKAFYLVCRTGDGSADYRLTDTNTRCEFDLTRITRDLRDEICKMVIESETRDPDSEKKIGMRQALSMAGGLR
jgi:hypothetical protein